MNSELEEALMLKDKELVHVLKDKLELENRWKNHAKDPSKIKNKSILEAIKLKSLEEFISH